MGWLVGKEKNDSGAITSNEGDVLFQTEILEEKLSSANNSINVLQHTVADRDADLQLAASNNRVCVWGGGGVWGKGGGEGEAVCVC